ncbi:hypothetical protein EXIGLDRAFT_121765 [Exidia glandulosa HHB12029]|uniref:Uncharacterized protein n=1 Tax=Exidia glandulosa HHB12029 TaxID=1314781 RepID=A0A165GE37_EXIGL|nr:hypothetical protein EXIGLDRAFT_121765 [Exidia glandulosa HHB12029]
MGTSILLARAFVHATLDCAAFHSDDKLGLFGRSTQQKNHGNSRRDPWSLRFEQLRRRPRLVLFEVTLAPDRQRRVPCLHPQSDLLTPLPLWSSGRARFPSQGSSSTFAARDRRAGATRNFGSRSAKSRRPDSVVRPSFKFLRRYCLKN